MANGQHPPFHPHMLGGDRAAQAKAAIAQQIGQMAAMIYTSVVAGWLKDPGPLPQPNSFQELARRSHVAAKDYFTGLGIADFDQQEQDA